MSTLATVLPSCSLGYFVCLPGDGDLVPWREQWVLTFVLISYICRTHGVRNMLLMLCSCIDFFIGIEAYFRFMGIILHCMGLRSMCGVFLPTHMPKYLYLKACVCVQEDVMKVIMLWVLIYTLSKMKKNKYLLSPPWAEVFRVLRESRVCRKRGIPIIPLKHLLLLMKELLLSCDFFFPVYLP